MPELPDIALYVEALRPRLAGRTLENVRISSPFLLRTFDPPVTEACGKEITGVRRIGKQIVIELRGSLFLVLHLMIAGRLHWKQAGAKAGGKINLAAFDVADGTLLVTEAGTKKRASLHLVRGEAALARFDRGGLDVPGASAEEFVLALRHEPHTLKRALTDPRLFNGIGNAYSDEILHRARLSPFRLSSQLSDAEGERLHSAAQEVLAEWIGRLRAENGDRFPEKVTAFHPAMAVHGKFGRPCPVCGTAVQRISYAENECNYCPRCQTGGKVFADRSLSRLLRNDWPNTIEELEQHPGLMKFQARER